MVQSIRKTHIKTRTQILKNLFQKKTMGNVVNQEQFEDIEKLTFNKCLTELLKLKLKTRNITILEQKVQSMNNWRILNSYPIHKMTYQSRQLFYKLESERRGISLWILFAENQKAKK